MQELYFFTLGLVLLALIFCKKEASFLFFTGFLIPLYSFSYEWHILFSWGKIIFLVAIINRLIFLGSGDQNLHSKKVGFILYGWLVGFLLFGTALTLGWMILDHRGSQHSRVLVRYAVQLFGFINLWGLAFVGKWFVKTRDDLSAAINGVIYGNLFNAVTGFYQVLALRFHLPWLKGRWIMRQEAYLYGDPLQELSAGFPRLSGLGGEPKHAAANLIVALILLLSLYIFDKRFRISHIKVKVSVLLIALALTFSVGSWISFVVILSYLAIQGLLARKSEAFMMIVLILLIGSTLSIFAGQKFIDEIGDKYVGYKLSSQSIEKYGDWKIFSYLIKNPASLIVGHGSGGSDSLQEDSTFMRTKKQFITTPRYCFTQIVFEQGMVGLMLVLIIAFIWANALYRAGFPAMGHFVLGGFLVCMVSHTTILYGFLFLCGCMVATINKDISD